MMTRQIFSTLNRTFPLALVSAAFFVNIATAQDTFDIDVNYEKGQQYRVQSQIEHAGTVTVDYAEKDTPPQHLEIDVKARLDYHERFVGSAAKPQAVRFYSQSHADIQLDKASTESELLDCNQLIVARINSESGNCYQIASVDDTLQQRELELLKNPADPLSLAGLLNKKQVKIGAEWEPSRDNLARFLFVDHIIASDVKLTLKEAGDNVAKVYITGRTKAEVDDALTEMTVTGVLQIDLAAKLVTGLRLNVIEERRPGQIAPGFEGKTKVDLRIALHEGIPQLSTDALKSIAQSKSIRNLLKWRSDSGKFVLKYDPAWKIIAAEDEAAVLRYVENGDLLAQCNIVRLASRPADKPLSLADFEKEVTTIISKDPTSHVIGAEQTTSVAGLKALRVTVKGVEEEVPLNWVYYNVASSDGRQVTFVFTLEEAIAGRVELAAKKIVDGFVFHSEKSNLKSGPQSAEPNSHDAKAASDPIR